MIGRRSMLALAVAIVAAGLPATAQAGAEAGAEAGDGPAARQTAQLAPNGAPGVINAVALGEIAPDRAIVVTPFADDDLNLEIKARFEDQFRQAGRVVSETAGLALSFETQVIPGRFSRSEGNMGRFEAGSGGLRLDLKIWSSTQDSLLGGRQKKTESRQVNLFHMNAVLRETASGKTLWQGDAYCEMLTADTRRIGLSMVEPLVSSLGQNVEQKPFDIE